MCWSSSATSASITCVRVRCACAPRRTSIRTARGCSNSASRPSRRANLPFSDEARRLVDETLARLPERTREIFQRSRFRGESYKEIAASMGTTVKSVEFEVSKAMKSLRVSLRDYLPLFYLFLLIDK